MALRDTAELVADAGEEWAARRVFDDDIAVGPDLDDCSVGPTPAPHAIWTQLKAGVSWLLFRYLPLLAFPSCCLGLIDWDLSNLKAGEAADLGFQRHFWTLCRVCKTLLDTF